MNKILVFLLLFLGLCSFEAAEPPEQYITRQGQISFFSYASAENIDAQNNQVLSILDVSTNQIAVSMLMNGFRFKKSLMHMHFNESYMESDLYPKATFEGRISDLDIPLASEQTRLIKGVLTIRDIKKEVDIKTIITHVDTDTYVLEGNFEVSIKDFDIKVPPVLEPNIAKTIAIKFRFEYQPYEK